MSKQLIVISGTEADKGRTFELPETGSVTLGRGGSTETRLNDLRVSRNHCEVQVEDGRVLISDSKSRVGTLVNGQKISTGHMLRSGDVVSLGDTQLRFEDDDIENAATVGDVMAMMQTLAPEMNPITPSKSRDVAAASQSGRTLAHFDIGPLLSNGHSSVVYKARDTREGRDVALKVLRSEFSRSEGEMQRFIRSLEPMLVLNHPNLVSIYEAGRTDGRCWVSMELVEGESIQQVIEHVGLAGMLDWQHALRVGLHCCRGLDFLSRHKIIHRNISPRTILMGKSDKMAKLGALLKAKAGDRGLELATKTGDILRDAPFLPPERARDDTHGDGRSDIYSLGASIYAMITGRPPFDGRSPVEVIAKIFQSEPPRPRDFQLGLPESFERVVMRMLAKKPEDRYQKPTELLEDFERIARNPSSVVNHQPSPAPASPTAAPPAPVPSPAPLAAPENVISVVCECGQQLQARSKYAGTRVRCPGCGKFIILPGGSPAHVAAMAPGQAPQRPSTMAPAKKDDPDPTPRKSAATLKEGNAASWSSSPKPPPSQAALWVVGAIVLALVVAGGLFLGGFFKPKEADGTPETPPAQQQGY